MKKSLKTIGILSAALFFSAGLCLGQSAGTAKAAKPAKGVKSVQGVAVAGYPLSPATAAEVVVTGYPIEIKDRVSIQRKAVLTFAGESKASEVKINMTDEYNFLKVHIQSSFKAGQISVLLIDPKGEKMGEYNLKSNENTTLGDKTTIQEEVAGNLQKEFISPLKGEWIIRAVPVAAEGTINVMILQEYAPGIGTTQATEVIGYPLPPEKR